GNTYRYEECPLAEVVRLLEHPHGKLSLHRRFAPLDGATQTAHALRLLVTEQLAAEKSKQAAQSPAGRGPEGQRVRQYTKVWTDDYGNYQKDVYRAYTKPLKDEQGGEAPAEIWHGKATGFHKNGNKSWEVDYRHGKREGEYTSWADNGVRTGLGTF